VTMRLSRKRKKWLRRHVPLGVVHDPVVMDNPARRWGRQSFIAERGHGKKSWSSLWTIWNPGGPQGTRLCRFVVGAGWLARNVGRLPKRLRAESSTPQTRGHL
jgi:hypothetical protein